MKTTIRPSFPKLHWAGALPNARARLRAWNFLLLLLLLGGAAETGRAANVTVTNLADGGPGTLREAIYSGAGIITFAVHGTIKLTSGALGIGRDLSIVGPGPKLLTIDGNHADRIFNILGHLPVPTVSISGLTITNGLAAGANAPDWSDLPGSPGCGGAITNGGHLTLSNCVVVGNAAWGGGGGAYGGQAVSGTGGDGRGGAIFNYGTLSLNSCLVSRNSAMGGYGGGAINPSHAGGGGYGQGGGIFSYGTLTLNGSTLSDNRASGGASGEEEGCVFACRQGGGAAGGAVACGAIMALTNCTLSGNFSRAAGGRPAGQGDGGGIWCWGFATLISCTVSENAVQGGACSVEGENGGNGQGGGIASVFYSPTLLNTIVADNTVAGGAGGGPPPLGSGGTNGAALGPDIYGAVDSQGYNLIGMAEDSSGWGAHDQVGWKAAPLMGYLGPLQDNGGPTPTMKPLPISAAIDRGWSGGLLTDQRGVPRPSDLPDDTYPNATGGDGGDVGAVEVGYMFSTLTANAGKIFIDAPTPEFAAGSQARLYAVPANGWQFSSWSGAASGANNPVTVLMNGDKSVTATFVCTVPDIIGDNPDAAFTGLWATGQASFSHRCYGDDDRSTAADGGGDTATFDLDMTSRKTGNYDFYTWYCNSAANTTEALYELVYGGSSHVTQLYQVNQSINGARWSRLDTSLHLEGGSSGVAIVVITNGFTDAGRSLVADAVKFTWSTNQTLTPGIKSITAKGGQQFSVTWFTEPGGLYRLQIKTNLFDGLWTDVGTDILATGDTLSATDTATGRAQCFYRVRRM